MTKISSQDHEYTERAFYLFSILALSILVFLIGAFISDGTSVWYGGYDLASTLFIVLIAVATGLGIYLVKVTESKAKQRPIIANVFTVDATLALLFGIPALLHLIL